ncbi:MAG: hypothetical protein AVDCRST_MAG26-169 [uncultured Chloroflexia bacterium]|uniref:Uncharacterized protein n=1 Tax=uncultured Chloroflexia bacterium TaxID=1672391 RepID=A0A6J4H2Q6_9CHLR|nr:MAG: hypothetical protein AVDCRST_MAG26-169 [uncultured Chloroflexia bacterium]
MDRPGPVSDRELRRKLTVRAHGQTLVLVKRPVESTEHVLQKALLWALYLPDYPGLRVEVPLPGSSRYKPDLLAFDGERPVIWCECGVVSVAKLDALLPRYRATHFVFSKWGFSPHALDAFAGMIEAALCGVRRTAPVEMIGFDADSAAFIGDGGEIAISKRDVVIRRWD